MRSLLAYRRSQRLALIPADTSPTPTVTAASPAKTTRLGGATVTVTGTGFMSSAGASYVESVYFGTTPATSFAVASATSLTAVAPAHAVGAVTLVVNTSGGCAKLLSAVTFITTAVVSAISPTSGPIAGGDVVDITVDDSTGATGATVGGVALTSFSIVNATTVRGTTGAHASGATDVIVTNATGASSPLVGAYTYGAAPVVLTCTPDHGPESTATSITVGGTGFVTGCTVDINGFACTSVAFVNSSQVTCDTPSSVLAGGPYNLTLTNPDAQSSTLTNAYTFDAPAGSVPVVSAVNRGVVDTAGGGGYVQVTVDDSTGCTGIKSDTGGGEVAWTSFAIVNGTTVKGIPGAHAAGTVDVVVTNATGDSTTGTGLLEYWNPTQITSVGAVFDAEKDVTESGGAVSAWLDQTSASSDLSQSSGALKPDYVANAFGSLHGLDFDGARRMGATRVAQAAGRSVFFVAKWTSIQNLTSDYAGNPPLTVVGDSSGSVAGGVGASAGSLCYSDANNTGLTATRGSFLNDGAQRLVGWTHDSATDTAKAYVGATQEGTDATLSTYAAWGWDTVGAGYRDVADGDGWVGTIGAVIIVDAVISGGDLTKLNKWAQQRWGTP